MPGSQELSRLTVSVVKQVHQPHKSSRTALKQEMTPSVNAAMHKLRHEFPTLLTATNKLIHIRMYGEVVLVSTSLRLSSTFSQKAEIPGSLLKRKPEIIP